MSYLNQAHDPRRRATAIVTVGAVHALLAVGLVTGLTVDFERIVEGRLIGTTVPLDPPPPEPTATPTPPVEPAAYVPPAPKPAVDLTQTPGPERVEFDEDKPVLPALPEIPRADVTPGPTTPALTPKRPAPRNGNWITDADYPRRALVDEAEGSVAYRLVIGTNGRVSSCELTRPSGHRALDDATCRLLTSRARFEAATDETGAKVVGTYTGSVRWEIPE